MEKTELKREEMIKLVKRQLVKLSVSDIQVLMAHKKEDALLELGRGVDIWWALNAYVGKPGKHIMMELSDISGYEIEMAFLIWATRIGMTKRVRDVEFIKDIEGFKKVLQEKYGEIGQNIAICIRCGQLTDYTIDELINGELRK